MKTIAAFACLIVVASAQQNWMGGMMPQNNMMNGMNGNMMNGNMLQQLMSMGMNTWNGMNGMNNMNNGQQRPQQQQQQQPMTNNVVGSLLGNMLGTVLIQGLRGQGMTAMGGDGGNMGGDMSRDELARLEEMAKMSMASEMFDLMRAYNKYKEDEEEFTNAMHALCLMVNATYAASQRYNFAIYNVTTEETPYQIEQEMAMMSEEEKLNYVVDKLINENKVFEEMFFRMASWACWSGQAYVNAAMKLEKMERGDKCDH